MVKKLRYYMNYVRFHTLHLRSRGAIEKWQGEHLVSVIRYLAQNVPLYKSMFEESALAASSVRGLADLAHLPILSKSHFIGRHLEEYTDASRRVWGMWTTTSGSTGTPFMPLRRAISNMPLYRDSLRYRFLLDKRWLSFTIDWARVAHIRIFPIHRRNHFVVPLEEVLNAPEKALERMTELAPDIIESYPSAVFEFAQYVAAVGAPFSVRYVMTSGERVSPILRSTIEKTLSCKLFDRYGLEEFGTVGYECDAHDGYHVNVESFIIEIVDENGAPVPEGDSGRVLITDLYNYQMPFIRYDTGDRGRISWEKCICGLDAMRVWPEGRDSAVITLSINDRKYHHFEFSESLKTFMHHILQFQIEKNSEESVIVRIVPGPSFDERVEDAVREKVTDLVGEGISVSIEKVLSIKKMPRGKVQVVVDSTAR